MYRIVALQVLTASKSCLPPDRMPESLAPQVKLAEDRAKPADCMNLEHGQQNRG
jgi:hypothetical protein